MIEGSGQWQFKKQKSIDILCTYFRQMSCCLGGKGKTKCPHQIQQSNEKTRLIKDTNKHTGPFYSPQPYVDPSTINQQIEKTNSLAQLKAQVRNSKLPQNGSEMNATTMMNRQKLVGSIKRQDIRSKQKKTEQEEKKRYQRQRQLKIRGGNNIQNYLQPRSQPQKYSTQMHNEQTKNQNQAYPPNQQEKILVKNEYFPNVDYQTRQIRELEHKREEQFRKQSERKREFNLIKAEQYKKRQEKQRQLQHLKRENQRNLQQQQKRNNQADQRKRMIIYFQENPLPIFNPSAFKRVHQQFISKYYKNQHKPQIGRFGKYYCGGVLGDPDCDCCNGFCGPNDGENCVKCMRLDQLRRGLKPNQLVNTDGSTCWVNENNRAQGIFTCGSMLNENGYHCGSATIVCYACQKLNRNIIRYRALFSQS